MPIVLDFGIAKAMRGTQLSQTGMFIGTPMYMSPEQITTGSIDGRADISRGRSEKGASRTLGHYHARAGKKTG